uniref:Protein tyrosine phosphatase receptor type N n=1 Tax=Zonotrichia albicollis TaxID=44394 RepID=A0A8D2QIK8_ZONAL
QSLPRTPPGLPGDTGRTTVPCPSGPSLPGTPGLTSGCLFIWSRSLPSLADGLFGQCQVGSVQDRPYFQVTSPVLQRLQDVLRHLMAQGLSWQDGITQYVISQEMERIPRLRLPPSLEPGTCGVCRVFWLQFGYQDGAHQHPSGSARQSSETSSLLGRVPAQTLFGAGPVPSYGGQPGVDGGHLFQDLGMLSLPREKAGRPDPASTRLQHSLRLPSDYRNVEEREQQAPLAAQPPSAQTGTLFSSQAQPLSLPLGLAAGVQLLELLAKHLHLSTASFINISVVGPALTFRIRQNPQNFSLADVASQTGSLSLSPTLTNPWLGPQRNEAAAYSRPSRFGDGFHSVLLTFIALACVAVLAIAVSAALCLRRHAKQREKERLAALGPEGAADTTFEYQELCRQHMAAKSLFGRADAPAAPAETSRVSSVSSQFSDAPQPSPSSHSSTPSWCEEPVQSNMDISTGHMILAYMEDHLRNRDRLAKEWQALCAYQAEPSVCSIAQSEANLKKNRNPDYVPYDHVRIKLKADSNPSRSDFINASPIIEHDPRMPAYIATQGPLSHTIADFWQMVWEHGCTVIVMLSPLAEDSVKQCDRYWPDEGSSLYHIYEVNLVSEHIWCEDFLVRSFYLKNVQSQETRTLTQFHFLSWPAEGIPTTTRPLLDFRRKVNKCYRGRSCPIIVHCSDGAGRTGTYILVDMVLNRMAKGVKEIDIAATLEHIRDQRPGMVQTKDQFEFALTAVAEEVNAILKALPQ